MLKALSVGVVAIAAVLLVLGAGPRPVEAASTVYVFSTANSGPGTFRAAVDQANNNSNVGTIKFLTNGPITLQEPVEYEGSQPLTLSGLFNTVIQGSSVVSTGDAGIACHETGLFESTDGADLTLLSLTFQNNPCGNGVYVYLNDDEDVSITLNRVVIRDNSDFGLSIYEGSDCSGGTDINLTVLSSSFSGNLDDGLSVEDYGSGGVNASLRFSQFNGNGDDGFDIYEDCDGDVLLTTLSSSFNGNGYNYYDAGEGIDIDEHSDGYVDVILNGLDASHNFDDGVDIEEYEGPGGFSLQAEGTDLQAEGTDGADQGDGPPPTASDAPQIATCEGDDITLTVNGGRANDNGSDGFDIWEDDCGSLYMTVTAVAASSNGDDGFDASERSGGDLHFTAGSATTADYNGRNDEDGNGIQLWEESYGSLYVDLSSVGARYNGQADEFGDGVDLLEEDNGDLILDVALSIVLSNRDDGVFAAEYGCGTLEAAFLSSTVSLNSDDGIDAEQEYDCGDPDGDLTLTFTSVVANADNNLELDGVVQN